MFDRKSVVELMVNEKGTDKTAAIFDSIRNVSPSLKNLAGSWLRELVVRYPGSVEQMIRMWLHYDTGPNQVYDLMSIAEKNLLIHGIGDRTEWEDISKKLMLWLDYVDEFNRNMIAIMTDWKQNLIIQGRYSEDTRFHLGKFLCKPLMLRNNPEDLVALVQYLDAKGGMDSFVTQMETLLISESPSAELAMFESWARLGVSPQVVYPKTSLGFARWDRFVFTEVEPLDYFCAALKQFLVYVDMYREHGHVFSDKDVIGLLLQRRNPQTLQNRLKYFGTVRGQKERSDELLAALHEWTREKAGISKKKP